MSQVPRAMPLQQRTRATATSHRHRSALGPLHRGGRQPLGPAPLRPKTPAGERGAGQQFKALRGLWKT